MVPKRRVALIGYGLAGRIFHAPFIAVTENLELAAIVTSNPERAAQAAQDYPDAKILSSPDEIFKSPSNIELAVVAAPNKHHFALAKAALEAGCAVVVDKPVATTSGQVRELMEISQKQKRLLTVFQNRRWDADFLTLQKIVAEDLLGKLTRFESRHERFRPVPKSEVWRESGDPADAGGLLFDIGSHLIDQACVLLGKPHSVYAEVNTMRPQAKVDDDVFVALQFDSGAVAHIWASTVARIPGQRFRLMGLSGSFEKYGLDPQEDALRAGQRPTTNEWGREPESAWGRIHTTTDGIDIDKRIKSEKGAYQLFYANVRDALDGRSELIVKTEAALLTTRIIEASFCSSRDRKLIKL